jgi:hypothetical protein
MSWSETPRKQRPARRDKEKQAEATSSGFVNCRTENYVFEKEEVGKE